MVKIGLIISCSARGTPSIMITIPFSGDVMRTRLALHEDGGSPPLFRESARRGGAGPRHLAAVVTALVIVAAKS